MEKATKQYIKKSYKTIAALNNPPGFFTNRMLVAGLFSKLSEMRKAARRLSKEEAEYLLKVYWRDALEKIKRARLAVKFGHLPF